MVKSPDIQHTTGFRYKDKFYLTLVEARETAISDILQEYLYPHDLKRVTFQANTYNLARHWDEVVERISKL